MKKIDKVRNEIKIKKLVKEDTRVRKAFEELSAHYDVELDELVTDYPYAYSALVNLAEELYNLTSELYAAFLESENYLLAEAEKKNLKQLELTIANMKLAGQTN